MNKPEKDSKQIDLSDVQELQLDTGLSEDLCKRILDPEAAFSLLEIQSIVNVLEKIPISLLMPIIKYMFSNVLRLVFLHKLQDTTKNIYG
jgi:hypothetical protein